MASSRSAAARLFRRAFPVLALLVPLLAATALAGASGSFSLERSVIEALIRVVMVVGLYIFIGNSGIVSFGHATFMAIAAYASAWQTCCVMLKPITMPGLPAFLRLHDYPVFPAGLAAVVLAGLAAFAAGLILMRLSGLAASISTLALMFILNVVYSNWDSVTMGTASIVGLPDYVTLWVAFGCAAFAILVAYLYQISPRGLQVRATRDDEVAAAAAGVSIYWNRLIAFTISGCIAGLGGLLQAHYLGTVTISSYFLDLTFLALAMLVVGGMHSLSGAVVGVVVISAIVDIFRELEAGIAIGQTEIALPAGTQELVLAGGMLLILVFRKEGIMGGREFELPEPVDPAAKAAG